MAFFRLLMYTKRITNNRHPSSQHAPPPKKIFAKDKNLRYLWCNTHLAKDLGIHPREIAGKSDFDFFPAALARKYRRDDRAVLRSGKMKDVEEHYMIDKKELWVHTVKMPVRNERGRIIGIQGVFWDMTNQKMLENSVKENEERIQKIANAIPDPVFVKNEKHRWIFINDAFCRLIGRKREQLIDRSDYDFFPKKQADVFWKQDDQVFQTGKPNINEEWITERAGHIRRISTKKRLLHLANHTRVLVGIIRDITKRERDKAALFTSQTKYSTLYNASSDAIMLLSPTGKFISGNPATLRLFGCRSEKEFTRCTPSGLSPRTQPNGMTSKQLASKMMQKAMTDGSHSFEWMHRKKSGGTFPASVLLTRMTIDGQQVLQATVRDRTEQKNKELLIITAQNRLEDEAQRSLQFKKALDSSSIATVITTPEPAILYVNPAWETLTGYTMQEALGQNPRILQSGKTPPIIYKSLWYTITKGQEFHTDDIINKRKDGSIFNAELRVYPIREEKHIQYYVGMQTDITSRILGEEAKSAFMSLVSHQLRTPLTAIRWGLNLIKKFGTFTPKQEEIFQDVHNATARMAETINIMLKLSHIESGELPVKQESINLCDVFQTLQTEYEPLAHTKNISCTFSCATHNRAVTDSGLLREILDNLLSNAIKYTPAGGTVEFSSQCIGNTARISISDTGLGIPKQEQQKVFSKFFRGTNVVNQIPDGTGLGLYLVYALTQLLGGSVTFQSKENSGTTFTVSLPLTPSYAKKNSHR